MKENKYDDKTFFEKYSSMDRSVKGLAGAGEWHELKRMLPDFCGKRVLDLGCGFGWHCMYAVDMGAVAVTGIDISENMLRVAREKTDSDKVQYMQLPIEDADFAENSYDIVISSLAFHYIENFDMICSKVSKFLTVNGSFVFSVEHPIFTAFGNEDWYYDDKGHILHWPVDNYFTDGQRESVFLGEKVTKYHRSLTSYVGSLLDNGFSIRNIREPKPDEEMMNTVPGMRDELRRPMMLIISAIKSAQ